MKKIDLKRGCRKYTTLGKSRFFPPFSSEECETRDILCVPI